jgi:hypothetical protein
MDNVTRAIHDELVLSYTQGGRVVPSTVAVVATSLRDALGFADEEEVHRAFCRARDMADVPTQRVLKEALGNYRAEHRAYIEPPKVAAIESDGSKLATNEETRYIMATQTLCGMSFGMDKELAMSIVKEFEADPKHDENVAYQRRWLKRNMNVYRAKLDKMLRAKA